MRKEASHWTVYGSDERTGIKTNHNYYTLMDVQTQEELTARERAMQQKAEQWLVAIQST